MLGKTKLNLSTWRGRWTWTCNIGHQHGIDWKKCRNHGIVRKLRRSNERSGKSVWRKISSESRRSCRFEIAEVSIWKLYRLVIRIAWFSVLLTEIHRIGSGCCVFERAKPERCPVWKFLVGVSSRSRCQSVCLLVFCSWLQMRWPSSRYLLRLNASSRLGSVDKFETQYGGCESDQANKA